MCSQIRAFRRGGRTGLNARNSELALPTSDLAIHLPGHNGNIIQSTNMMQTTSGHALDSLASVGVGYFVAVRAQDTGGVDYDYKLVITD